MEFHPSFPEKTPYLSGIFPENPCIKSEILMPEENNTSMYQNNNFHHFQNHHPLNVPNHNHPACFSTEGSPSSIINPLFSLAPTHPSSADSSSHNPNESLKVGLVNSHYYSMMPFAPNSTKVEHVHGYPINSNKALWDFSQKIPLHSVVTASSSSQPQVGVGPSLSPSPVYENNAHWNSDHKGGVVAEKKQVQRNSNSKIQNNINNIIKGQWTAEEDRALIQLVKRFGLKKWSQIARLLNGRVGKQCRERWHNHLRPNIRKESWNEEEDKILIEAHMQVGNKWAEIARRIPGRTENTIKNHWNATKRRQNAMKRQKNKRIKGTATKAAPTTTLLQNYIKQVTAAEEAKKELKKSMTKMSIRCAESETTCNINNDHGLFRVRYESSDGDFSSEDWCTTEEEEVEWTMQRHVANGSYVPVMPSGSAVEDSSMDYEVAMEMVPEVQMKKEMDLMEMIYRKP
ncbi:hypothetical protein VNO77_20216 [Canavalia gladiata]|uniref:Uncharacterized protein n=1 Tax=Canavalia gladiata TaxID=3824 RepID=A0AAN9QL87_CANGL